MWLGTTTANVVVDFDVVGEKLVGVTHWLGRDWTISGWNWFARVGQYVTDDVHTWLENRKKGKRNCILCECDTTSWWRHIKHLIETKYVVMFHDLQCNQYMFWISYVSKTILSMYQENLTNSSTSLTFVRIFNCFFSYNLFFFKHSEENLTLILQAMIRNPISTNIRYFSWLFDNDFTYIYVKRKDVCLFRTFKARNQGSG